MIPVSFPLGLIFKADPVSLPDGETGRVQQLCCPHFRSLSAGEVNCSAEIIRAARLIPAHITDSGTGAPDAVQFRRPTALPVECGTAIF